MIQLPNNRLILNGHRILCLKDLYDYLTKKFKNEIKSEKDFVLLSEYKNLKIAIWHAWSFLEKEDKKDHDKIIKELSKYWEIKQTWIH